MFQVGASRSSEPPCPFLTRAIGRKPGETKMVKNGDAVEAHQVEPLVHPGIGMN